jgi:hypothetical protein
MSSNETMDKTGQVIGWGSLGFGLLGAVAPGALRAAYGDRASGGGSLDYFSRTWGTRTAVLGALTLMAASDEERKRIAALAAVMNAVDSLVAFREDGMPAGTRAMAGLTSAGFSAASAYVAMNL